MIDPELLRRLWQKVRVTPGCWEWLGCMDRGYGVINRIDKPDRKVRVHRVSWEHYEGPIPSDRFVLHHCDNRRCLNPSHLFLGTKGDNIRDAAQKGKLWNQKLTLSAVAEIREERARGVSAEVLAERFGVSADLVWLVEVGKSWAHASRILSPAFVDQPKPTRQ